MSQSPKKKGKRRQGVAVSWLFPDKVAGEFCVSMANLMGYDSRRHRHVSNLLPMSSGPNLNTARNKQARVFLEDTFAEWLLIVDSDMVFEPDVVDRILLEADPVRAPIVGGLCFGETTTPEGSEFFATLYGYNEDLTTYKWDTFPENTMFPVNGTGTGFLLIHYTVFQAVGEKFAQRAPLVWFEEMVMDGRLWSEDSMFCLRAQQCGFPIHVHTGVEIGHVKRRIIDNKLYQDWRASL